MLQARTLTALSPLAASPLCFSFLLHSSSTRLLRLRLCCWQLSQRQQQPHRLRVFPLVMCRPAVSRGTGVENKLPQVLNAGVGLFASLTCFYCFALVLFLCATPLSSLSPSLSSSPSCRVKCPPGPQPILYLEYKESSAAFDPP